jgi:two-component system chemotaxis response regulator CheB
MCKIRVLLIDDSVAVRRLLTEALNDNPALEVVGSAANGRIGLAMLPRSNPDVVVLDLKMPEMDGLEVLAAIRTSHPKLPVVVFSALTHRGATTTLDALAMGANDYVTKPSSLDGEGSAMRRITEELVPRLKALGTSPGEPSVGVQHTPKANARTERAARRPEIVVIGVSTGGPNALAALLPAIPGDFPVPILIVQHMPPIFTRQLARRLDARSDLTVTEAVDGQVVLPGQAVVAPGDWHMVVSRRGQELRVATHQGPQENSCRPSADVLFRSAAQDFGGEALAVVMTGMGQDGLLGAEEIRRAGGQVLAQDEPSSVVWGMPGYVVRAGLADRVLPLDQLAAEIVRRASGESAHGRHSA